MATIVKLHVYLPEASPCTGKVFQLYRSSFVTTERLHTLVSGSAQGDVAGVQDGFQNPCLVATGIQFTSATPRCEGKDSVPSAPALSTLGIVAADIPCRPPLSATGSTHQYVTALTACRYWNRVLG